MTEGRGYCRRRQERQKEKQLQKDLEDALEGKIIVIDRKERKEE